MRRLSCVTALLVLAGVCLLRPAIRAQTETRTITLAGKSGDGVSAVAVDAFNNTYLAGVSAARALPATANAFQRSQRGFGDAFVAKFNANGALEWLTYLGGSDTYVNRFANSADRANAIGVDGQGNVYVGGATASDDFPTTNAYQAGRRSTGSSTDGFLAKLDPTGSRLVYSTFLGGVGGSSSVEALSVGASGEVWVAIRTSAQQFPVTRTLSPTTSGDVLVARFQPPGSPAWVTRVGSSGSQLSALGIAVDPSAQPTVIVGSSLVQLDASGARINSTWSLPGGKPFDLAAGADGSIVVVGGTTGAIPLKNAWQPERDPAGNGFVAILGSQLVPDLVSYLSGATGGGYGVDVDRDGGVHIAFDFFAATRSASGGAVPEHPDGPVFVSADRADSWTWSSGGLFGPVFDMTADAGGNVYAVQANSVSRSSDGGRSWSLWKALSLPAALIASYKVAFDPRDHRTLYAESGGLVRVDLETGSHTLLRRAEPGASGFQIRSLEVNPHDGSVWLGSNNGLEVSFDRGVTWIHRDRGFLTSGGRIDSPVVIAFEPTRAGTMYAGFDQGIYRSVDSGLSWNQVSRLDVESLLVDPVDPNRLYGGTYNNGVHVSGDGGLTWVRMTPPMGVRAIAISNLPPFPVYATVYEFANGRHAFWTSSDRGATWFAGRFPAQRAGATVLLPAPGDPNRLYSATSVVVAAPYVMRMDRRSSAQPVYSQSFASRFATQGQVVDVAATPDGQTAVAIADYSGNFTVLRIAR